MADIYNVVRGDGVFFEGMTKEQVYKAIADATGMTAQDVDGAFISKIKEINKQGTVQIWIGTTAEYNEIPDKVDDVLYITTDDTFVNDTGLALDNLQTKIDANYESVGKWMSGKTDEINAIRNDLNSKTNSLQSQINSANGKISRNLRIRTDLSLNLIDKDWSYTHDISGVNVGEIVMIRNTGSASSRYLTLKCPAGRAFWVWGSKTGVMSPSRAYAIGDGWFDGWYISGWAPCCYWMLRVS